MNRTRTSWALLLAALVAIEASAQTSLSSRSNSATNVPAERTITLSVPTGTPLHIALDREVRVRKVGQTVHARLMQSVYAFDQQVLPVGAEVSGHIARIGSPVWKRVPCHRTLVAYAVSITNAVPQAIDLLPLEACQNPRAVHGSSEMGSGATYEIR